MSGAPQLRTRVRQRGVAAGRDHRLAGVQPVWGEAGTRSVGEATRDDREGGERWCGWDSCVPEGLGQDRAPPAASLVLRRAGAWPARRRSHAKHSQGRKGRFRQMRQLRDSWSTAGHALRLGWRSCAQEERTIVAPVSLSQAQARRRARHPSSLQLVRFHKWVPNTRAASLVARSFAVPRPPTGPPAARCATQQARARGRQLAQAAASGQRARLSVTAFCGLHGAERMLKQRSSNRPEAPRKRRTNVLRLRVGSTR